jgi:5-methylcytosine-specific restriction protein A
MPPKPLRACTRQGCKAHSSDGSNYCAAHKPKPRSGWASYHKEVNGSSRHKAGYGSGWDKLRAAVLNRDRHLCVPCYKLGLFTMATAVDHIQNKASGGTNDINNLQSICYSCHKRKTQQEAIGARKTRTCQPEPPA